MKIFQKIWSRISRKFGRNISCVIVIFSRSLLTENVIFSQSKISPIPCDELYIFVLSINRLKNTIIIINHCVRFQISQGRRQSNMAGQITKEECLETYKHSFVSNLLENKVALITGGGSGIGFRTAEILMRYTNKWTYFFNENNINRQDTPWRSLNLIRVPKSTEHRTWMSMHRV